MLPAFASSHPPLVATRRSDGGSGSGVDAAALQALTSVPGSDAASTVDHILKKLNTLADAVKLKTKQMAVGSGDTVAPSMSDGTAEGKEDDDDHFAQRLHASRVSSLRQDQILSPAARAASRARLEGLAARDERIAHASHSLLTPGLVKFTPLPPLASSLAAGGEWVLTPSADSMLPTLQGPHESERTLPNVEGNNGSSTSFVAHADGSELTSPTMRDAVAGARAASMAIGIPSEDEEEQDEESRLHAAVGSSAASHKAAALSGVREQQAAPAGIPHKPHATEAHKNEQEGNEYVSFEVSRFQERVRGILGQGIAYTDIHRIFDATCDAADVTLPPPPTTTHVSWMQLLRRNLQVAGATENSSNGGNGAARASVVEPLPSPSPLLDPSEKVPVNVQLPDWLRNRPDFRLVEEEQKSYGGARLQGKGLTGGAMVLVKRALESPGTMRGAKDIEILSMWLREQPQFSQLSALQLAVVARSLVAEHLDPSAKMSPTAESVYVVLSGTCSSR